MIKDKLKILALAILGEVYKLCMRTRLIRPRKLKNTCEENPKVIVSLTSYGRRVRKVHYTIISLLRQNLEPDEIVLWLDNGNWNDSNLPSSLMSLKKYGLKIRFCRDIKSYKKLIPTLLEYPEAIIITCDDDIYYRRNMVKRLVSAYKNDSTKIYAHRAHKMTFSKGRLDKYDQWPEEVSDMEGVDVFPTSGGGTLYTKNLLYADICNEALFSKLSPKADDVWFYFMGFMKGSKNVVLPYKGYIYIPLDVFYQTLHKGSNLASANCGESMNDEQIRSVMSYYNINDEDLS